MGKFDEHVIPDIMPTCEVHLIGGPSGSGKTTLSFQMMQILQVGGIWWGKQIAPQPSVYIACDRSANATQRTMARVGIPFDFIPVYGLADEPAIIDLPSFLNKVMKEHPGTKVIWVDGLASETPEGKINDYKLVASFLKRLALFAKKNNVTLIGLVHSTKCKEGERLLNPRQRILGSVAWASYSDTIIIIEPEDQENPTDDRRVVMVCTRNSQGIKQSYKFDANGRLVECESAQEQVQQFMLDSRMPESGTVFSTKDAIGWAKEANQSDATAERWLKARVGNGSLEKVGRGQYRVGTSVGDRASVN
jgi:energy-coupling factor transporter ATP-binding protein EcfA2